MGRMHSKGKGMSSSALPYSRTPPSWCKADASEVGEQICKLARKGLTPSQIGVILRDSHGVPQVRFVTGNKVLRILKSSGMSILPPMLMSPARRGVVPLTMQKSGRGVCRQSRRQEYDV